MPSNLDIDASAERLLPDGTATPAPCGVLIKAGPGNSTNIVYVGFSDAVTAGTAAATDGFPLAVGDQPWIIPPNLIPGGDAANIYVIGSAANLKAFYYILPYVPAPAPSP